MLTLLSWNVLAPEHAHRRYYPSTKPDHLLPETRVPRLHAELDRRLDEFDVLALQEVNRELVDWLARSGPNGTHVSYAPRPHQPDGVALVSRRHELGRPEQGISSDTRRPGAAAT